MTRYNEIALSDNTMIENLLLAKQDGYTHVFLWINSDEGWMFLAKSSTEAENEAIELYMKEKNEKDKEFAEKYFREYIDILEIDDYIDILNS